MKELPYGVGIEVSLSPEEAEKAIREALADEGFGILTEIDVAATMKMKLDVNHTWVMMTHEKFDCLEHCNTCPMTNYIFG